MARPFGRLRRNGGNVMGKKKNGRTGSAPGLPAVQGSLGARIWKSRGIYLLLLPGILWYILFAYVPMSGLILAFKTYKANEGIWGSPWAGLKYFERLIQDPRFLSSIVTTIKINLGRLVITFPFAIILAVLFNELRLGKFKKGLQTVFTFPHFLSWVVVAGIVTNVLAYDGMVNNVLGVFGMGPIKILGNEKAFVPLVYITEIWKSCGWSAIIYMAAIAGIDQEQYEAASIDGASRWQKIKCITIPCILPTITVMFILATGNVMTAGFNQIFNLSNDAVKNVAETLDMYIYNISFKATPEFGYSTALSLFRSVVNLVLLVFANTVSKKLGGNGLMG